MFNSVFAEGPGAALLPRPDESTVVIAPPAPGQGYWAGAPSAALGDDGIYLAYRLRRPISAGRGYAIAVARSADGVHFETLTTIGRDEAGAESLERPGAGARPLGAVAAVPELCHARHQALADRGAGSRAPGRVRRQQRVVVLPGDAQTGVKDPVIRLNGTWQMWACCHPLADPAETDQMVTDYATSSDGLDWTWHGTALSGRPGSLGRAGHPDQRRSWQDGEIR